MSRKWQITIAVLVAVIVLWITMELIDWAQVMGEAS